MWLCNLCLHSLRRLHRQHARRLLQRSAQPPRHASQSLQLLLRRHTVRRHEYRLNPPLPTTSPLTPTVMMLPIRVVWNLQVPRCQRIAIIALFASGSLCIAFATLRVIQVARQSKGTIDPNPIWLALWSAIETCVAVCIGCCPAYACAWRTARAQRVPYDTHGYRRHAPSHSRGDQLRPDVMEMNTVTVGTGRRRMSKEDPCWDDTRSSQEILAAEDKGIMVTTTLQQNHEPSVSRKPSGST